MIDYVLNQGDALGINADIERSMNAQISNMQVTASCLRVMANAQHQMALNQDRIAATAMRSETRTRENGTTYTVRVPNVAARAAARTAAQAHRAFALALLRKAQEIGTGTANLQQAMTRVKAMFDSIMEQTIGIDSHHAARLEGISDWMRNFTNRMSEIRDSIPEGGFPLSSADILALGFGPIAMDNPVMSLIEQKVNAGMPSFTAFNLDPVNMSTGNFIYSKEDISISGRNPLWFTRFYNSIGGTEDVLGLNWTHNHNIRLYDKDEALFIMYGEGQVETYRLYNSGGWNSYWCGCWWLCRWRGWSGCCFRAI